MPRVPALIALSVAALLAVCDTVVTGATQEITITTQPDGAACVRERDGDVIATIESTPATVGIERAQTPVRLGCSKAHHLDANRVVISDFEGSAASNIVFGALVGIVVDASSGAVNEYSSEVSVMLPPASFGAADEHDVFFDVLKADAQYRAGEGLSAAQASGLCRKNQDNQDCVTLLSEIEAVSSRSSC